MNGFRIVFNFQGTILHLVSLHVLKSLFITFPNFLRLGCEGLAGPWTMDGKMANYPCPPLL